MLGLSIQETTIQTSEIYCSGDNTDPESGVYLQKVAHLVPENLENLMLRKAKSEIERVQVQFWEYLLTVQYHEYMLGPA